MVSCCLMPAIRYSHTSTVTRFQKLHLAITMTDQPFNIDSLPDVPLVDRGYGYEVGTELFLVRHGESMTNTYAKDTNSYSLI